MEHGTEQTKKIKQKGNYKRWWGNTIIEKGGELKGVCLCLSTPQSLSLTE